MAATDPAGVRDAHAPGSAASPARSLLAAALALPGVLPAGAEAQVPPESGVVKLTYLRYRDWQPGAARMTVENPALHVLAPFAERWAVEGNLVYDAMSGASPLFFNTLSRATVNDYRTAGDARLTRWFDRWSLSAGGGYSGERDYISRYGSVEVRGWTADRNTTVTFAAGGASDLINPVNQVVVDAKRHTVDLLLGVTQNLSPTQALQSNLTWSSGHGYYSDPYKPLDTRPDSRRVLAWLLRYNQYFADSDGTLKVAYRYLHDSFGAGSSMVEAAWNQPLPHGFSIQPNVRYLSQSAASFYFDPPFPAGYRFGSPYTADTRLASWGAVTVGAWLVKSLADGWTVDLAYQYYRQQPGWRAGGRGSPGIEPFMASWWQLGVARAF